jgi:hypothetical protein
VEGSAHAVLGAIEASISMGFARPEIRDLYEIVLGVPALLARIG